MSDGLSRWLRASGGVGVDEALMDLVEFIDADLEAGDFMS
jgi:hypothetical protein